MVQLHLRAKRDPPRRRDDRRAHPTPGQKLRIRLQVEGTTPTTRAKVWKDGSAEPGRWQFSTTDSTAGLQAAGGIRLQSYVSPALTGGSMTVRWDDLAVSAIGSGPADQPPTAVFSSSTSGLAVSVDSSGSSDSDGTIVARSWTFGDGGTATGTTASHTFAAPGTYPVTLTVTDDKGVAASSTTPTGHLAAAGQPASDRRLHVVGSDLTASVDSSGSSDPDGRSSGAPGTSGTAARRPVRPPRTATRRRVPTR